MLIRVKLLDHNGNLLDQHRLETATGELKIALLNCSIATQILIEHEIDKFCGPLYGPGGWKELKWESKEEEIVKTGPYDVGLPERGGSDF